jgi:hypothetical protein
MFIVIHRDTNDSYWRATSIVYDTFEAACLEAKNKESLGLKVNVIRVGVPIRDARQEHHEY